MEKADLLLVGAVDMHAHGYPYYTLRMPPRVNDYDWALSAREAGMAGFVIKSHMWPTVSEAYLLSKVVEGIAIFGSITLNYTVGGLSPLAVQIAAESGAKVVFMPTWCSKNDVDKGCHYRDRMRPFITVIDEETKDWQGISLVDDRGNLVPQVNEIIKLCKQYDLVLASGHISIEESLILCKSAVREGVKFVLTHPLTAPLIAASLEQMKEIARMGGYIENVFMDCMPMHRRMHPKQIVEVIEYIGCEQCIMSSDAIEAWNPKPPEVLRMFIASLLALGVREDAVYHMTHTNPAHLTGLDIKRDDVT